MKLSNLKFWKATPDVEATADLDHAVPQKEPEDNVVQLTRTQSAVTEPAGHDPLRDVPSFGGATTAKQENPCGPMSASQLNKFFEVNFFGLGRHDGAHYRTQDALERGRALVVSRFQNILATVVDQKQARVDKLRDMELQTKGVCSTTTAQLILACNRLERDISALREQFDLSAQGKGWVLVSLNEYQIGFGKGVREAVDAEMLGL